MATLSARSAHLDRDDVTVFVVARAGAARAAAAAEAQAARDDLALAVYRVRRL